MRAVVATNLFVGLLTLSAGCFGNFDTEFPEGLEPLGDNTASPPAPQGGEQYPEVLSFVSGTEPGMVNQFKWVHARGYIHAPIEKVWEALQEPAVVASKRQDPDYTYTLNVEPEYEYSIEFMYTVEDIIDVSWREVWRYGIIEGDADNIEFAIVRNQKIWGSTFIGVLEGSMILIPVTDNITEFQGIRHLEAAGGSIDDIKETEQDRFDAMVAFSKDQPLPEIP